MNNGSKVLALLIAPAVTAICLVNFAEEAYPTGSGWIGVSTVMLIGVFPLSYFFAMSLGLISIAVLTKQNRLSIFWVTVAGFINGTIAFLIVDLGFLIHLMNSPASGNPEITSAQAQNLILGPLLTKNTMLLPISGLSASIGALIYCAISGITNHSKPTPKDGAV